MDSPERRPSPGPPAPGLYLHLPFCSAICPYCDFSVLTGGAAAKSSFVDDLLAEVDLWAEAPGPFPWDTRPFDTVYLGGGTPSDLEPAELRRLWLYLRRRLPVAQDARLFFEANPEDVHRESLASWRDLGVGTLSLGVQSFDDEALAFLGRRHSPAQARAAVKRALDADLDTVSLDLIFGLPQQSPEALEREIAAAVELAPHHVSAYQLTIHGGTPFGFRQARGELEEMDDDTQGELFRRLHERLGEAGYRAYEASNFARAPEHRSRHNAKYWHHVPYLGLGPSAHSFGGVEASVGKAPRGRRWWNHRKLKPWREAVRSGELPVVESEELGARELLLEALMLGLRTAPGVDLEELEARYGVDLRAPNHRRLEALEAEALVRPGWAAGRLALTLEGLAVADGIAASLEVPSRRH